MSQVLGCVRVSRGGGVDLPHRCHVRQDGWSNRRPSNDVSAAVCKRLLSACVRWEELSGARSTVNASSAAPLDAAACVSVMFPPVFCVLSVHCPHR